MLQAARCRRAGAVARLLAVRYSTSTVDDAEIQRFTQLSSTWWDPKGPMEGLHRLNGVRVPFLRGLVSPSSKAGIDRPMRGLSILDIGCGAGILSEPLCRLGADVVGLDATENSIRIARDHAKLDPQLDALQYECDTAESVAAQGRTFDVVVASEVLEHVSEVDHFLDACTTLVKPGGHLVISTINKTAASYLLAIVAAEDVLGLVPRKTHTWDKFVTPEDLEASMQARGMRAMQKTGLLYNPVLPRWSTVPFTGVNYMMHFMKPDTVVAGA